MLNSIIHDSAQCRTRAEAAERALAHAGQTAKSISCSPSITPSTDQLAPNPGCPLTLKAVLPSSPLAKAALGHLTG